MSSESKAIEENFKKIREVEKMIREKYGDPEAGFNASSYFFGTDHRPLALRAQYRKPKANGEFTKKLFDVLIYADYCPFTGKPLYENLKTESDE